MTPPRTTLAALAPWIVLVVVVGAGLTASALKTGAEAAVFQLLSTVAGVCGGALLPRKSDAPTTTVTAGDPTTVTTGPAQ